MFKSFLESLKRADNAFLIESVIKGYELIFESPTAEIVVDDSIEFLDFHIEDYVSIYGEEKTLGYINDVINKLERTNEPIKVNKNFLDHEAQISELSNPQNSFPNKKDLETIIFRLKMIKKNLEEKISEMIPA